MGSVASLLAMDRTTLTANLKPLERDGLLRVEVDPADRRARRIVLTQAGMARVAAALPIWTRTHAAIDADLPAEGVPLRAGLSAIG
jgi:DNA-binding MarR family transcriptional regulator